MLTPQLNRNSFHPTVVRVDQLLELFFELFLHAELSLKSIAFKQAFEFAFDIVLREKMEPQKTLNLDGKLRIVDGVVRSSETKPGHCPPHGLVLVKEADRLITSERVNECVNGCDLAVNVDDTASRER